MISWMHVKTIKTRDYIFNSYIGNGCIFRLDIKGRDSPFTYHVYDNRHELLNGIFINISKGKYTPEMLTTLFIEDAEYRHYDTFIYLNHFTYSNVLFDEVENYANFD